MFAIDNTIPCLEFLLKVKYGFYEIGYYTKTG